MALALNNQQKLIYHTHTHTHTHTHIYIYIYIYIYMCVYVYVCVWLMSSVLKRIILALLVKGQLSQWFLHLPNPSLVRGNKHKVNFKRNITVPQFWSFFDLWISLRHQKISFRLGKKKCLLIFVEAVRKTTKLFSGIWKKSLRRW